MRKPYYFTTCNVNGNKGPTQEDANEYYKGTFVTIYSGIQEWIVPDTGLYYIESAGSSGTSCCLENKGGKGAFLSIYKKLHSGDHLYLLVGQQGIIAGSYWGGGGGGASFVAKEDHNSQYHLDPVNKNVSLILVAAGGCGSGDCNEEGSPKKGGDGLCEIPSDTQGGTHIQNGASGGGSFDYDSSCKRTKSFLHGGEGGESGSSSGGFGCGGNPLDAGGGGGGYKGGNSYEPARSGDGGYSYFEHHSLVECRSGENSGVGFITIIYMQTSLTSSYLNYPKILISFLFIFIITS